MMKSENSQRNYLVLLLFLVSLVSYLDRQVLAILIEPIKHDLKLSDSQLGLISGLFFSLFFIVAGFPLARWADRGDRRFIISLCIGTWSIATAACGMAQNFVQLALTRAMVAIGEAGGAPASSSIIGDSFPPPKRPRVFALMSAGSAVGIASGIFFGGILSEHVGWRVVFVVLSIPGLALAALFALTVKEPNRPNSFGSDTLPQNMGVAFMTFLRLPSYLALVVITIFASAAIYAVLAWFPAFLIRVHGLSTGAAGLQMGIGIAVGLLAGNLACGEVSHRLGARDSRWLIWIVAAGMLACIPLAVLALTIESTPVAMVCFTLFMIANGFWAPPVSTLAIGLVDSRSPALISTTIPLYQAIGGAIGPSFVGFATEGFTGRYGVFAIRYALLAALGGCLVAGVTALFSSRIVARDYRY